MLALTFVAGFVIGFLLAWAIGRGQIEEAMKGTLAIASETVYLLEKICQILEWMTDTKVDTERASEGSYGDTFSE
jgi:hypothetical protein